MQSRFYDLAHHRAHHRARHRARHFARYPTCQRLPHLTGGRYIRRATPLAASPVTPILDRQRKYRSPMPLHQGCPIPCPSSLVTYPLFLIPRSLSLVPFPRSPRRPLHPARHITQYLHDGSIAKGATSIPRAARSEVGRKRTTVGDWCRGRGGCRGREGCQGRVITGVPERP